MALMRRAVAGMCFLFLFGNVASVTLFESPHLDCTNDYVDHMNCDLEAVNCTQHIVTFRNENEKVDCIFKQCDNGNCCCSSEIKAVFGETFEATLWKSNIRLGSSDINISDSVKLRPPTITSVKESNGNFEVMWRTNMESCSSFNSKIVAKVRYYKKGDTNNFSEFDATARVQGQSYYEISGQQLEPSTEYVVCVKNYLPDRGYFSDCSKESEFTTPSSSDALPYVIIGSLSIAAVLICSAIYGCSVKFKATFWDTVSKSPNPKLFDINPRQQIFKPVMPIISSVSVEPLIPDNSKSWLDGSLTDTSGGSIQESSGISTRSSCLSYANTDSADIKAIIQDALCKTFNSINLNTSLTNPPTELNKDSGLFSSNFRSIRTDDINSGSSSFENMTYSIVIPSFPQQMSVDSTEHQMLCDSVYHPSKGEMVICAVQQEPASLLSTLPPEVSSLMASDMSYQQCNTDSVRFSYPEDSRFSSSSSGSKAIASLDPVSKVEAADECSDELFGSNAKLNAKMEKLICDENPCYNRVPEGLGNFPSVDGDYQAFQSLVEQPDALLSDKQGAENNEHLNKYPEGSSLSPVVLGLTSDVQADSVFLISLLSANQSMPVVIDSGYQSV